MMPKLPEPIFPRTGCEFICELPKIEGEWRIMPFKGQDGKYRMIVINPNCHPYVIEDGIAKELIFNAP